MKLTVYLIGVKTSEKIIWTLAAWNHTFQIFHYFASQPQQQKMFEMIFPLFWKWRMWSISSRVSTDRIYIIKWMKRNQQTMWLRSWTWSKENMQGRLESSIAWQKPKLKNLHMNCKSEKLSVIIFMQADPQKTKPECTKAGWTIQCRSSLPLLHSAWESTRKT